MNYSYEQFRTTVSIILEQILPLPGIQATIKHEIFDNMGSIFNDFKHRMSDNESLSDADIVNQIHRFISEKVMCRLSSFIEHNTAHLPDDGIAAINQCLVVLKAARRRRRENREAELLEKIRKLEARVLELEAQVVSQSKVVVDESLKHILTHDLEPIALKVPDGLDRFTVEQQQIIRTIFNRGYFEGTVGTIVELRALEEVGIVRVMPGWTGHYILDPEAVFIFLDKSEKYMFYFTNLISKERLNTGANGVIITHGGFYDLDRAIKTFDYVSARGETSMFRVAYAKSKTGPETPLHLNMDHRRNVE